MKFFGTGKFNQAVGSTTALEHQAVYWYLSQYTVEKFTYPHNIPLIKNRILLICSIFLNSDLMNQCRF